MQPLQFLVPIDALAEVEGLLKYAILGLVLVNMVTRILAHSKQRKQVDDDDSNLSRWLPHSVVSILLLLASFAFMIVEPHGGMVMSVLVLGMFVADFFEFEARQVEARNGLDFERPKAAITASVIVLLYAAFQSLFFLVKDYWNLVI
ncbi:hypothetical protein SAMN04487950_2152 [Halogranum rubrum]|uniref:DUF7313 domain-containing protein n=2 Tax=Halogranum rubrum TaxID=553466 RepID=A0A1I4EJ44_9EURY|nr:MULTISPECIES: hypothetical protein [Halogranum]EJN60496.1 hypothetical protein HSB1_10990 [Halogranum salarium B-1]SFL04587.1 hypothetical protein SAMN04487950_2152 [Halogranum rubrum]